MTIASQKEPIAIETASILGLPREIRDLIYVQLLCTRTTPPKDPSRAGERDPNSSIPCTIYYQVHSARPTLLQLKLCSRQIYHEVRETIIKRLTCPYGQAELDIMLRGSSIWPTWVTLPVTPWLDPVIDVKLRIFEAPGGGSEFSTGAYRALWTLFRLLVYHGPCFTHNRGMTTPLEIERLHFDISFCFPTSVDDLFGTARECFDRLKRLASDNVGLGHIAMMEASLGPDLWAWRLQKLPMG
ncbi:hypothetical protein M433DRAFT_456823 [Acidomyces richmondensis BFW]|nr:MAG: hypothetical protein FE78DRAFT_285849 [Acidomyces sp. 'richmondensis']KYG50306.1 hypothetical protein M433DRAFT_456823 [Acidomyces richmondensis BFW]